jgi:septal ring factor EnvC (AmiA/AmiB activator)
MGAVFKYVPNKYKEENLRESFSSLIGETEKLLRALQGSLSCLPRVEKDGTSECTFAKALFAQKEEAQRAVAQKHASLQEYVPIIEEEVARTHRTLSELKATKDSLHREEPKRQLSDAEIQAKREYDRVIEQRTKLQDILKRMESVLNRSAARKFPGGEPRRSRPGEIALSGATEPVSAGNEMDSLRSLGALSRSQGLGMPETRS